ncbi:MAG TPA: NAD-dependent epimerase/dehydratase family protein [Gaiellaceae bacterium]
MEAHLIVGAGSVGSATALLLAEEDRRVSLVSRSGTGPDHPNIERIAADAADRAAMLRLSVGAEAIYNCANPAYHRWPTDWPPIASSLLQAARECKAVLVTLSNLYGYGPVDHPMREDDELAATSVKGRVRARMWEEAKAAHDSGQVRACEARASDFFGPGDTANHLGRMIPRVLAGKTVRVIGSPDTPHSWTYVPDVARTLVTLARDERAWGRPWHVPTNPPLSQREVVAALADLAGLPAPEVRGIPNWTVRAIGVASPMLRELREVTYQLERPFVLDSSAVTETFGLEPTPMNEALASTLESVART